MIPGSLKKLLHQLKILTKCLELSLRETFCRKTNVPHRPGFDGLSGSTGISLEKSIRPGRNLLEPSTVKVDVTFKIRHFLSTSMVDGKICSVIAGTSSAQCHICKAMPSEMNNLDKVSKKVPNRGRPGTENPQVCTSCRLRETLGCDKGQLRGAPNPSDRVGTGANFLHPLLKFEPFKHDF